MMNLKVLYIICALLLPAAAQAQYGYSANASGNINVAALQSINVTNLSGAVSFNNAGNYFTGQEINDFARISIKSNVNWQLSVASQSQYFNPQSAGASSDMPASILGFRLNGYSSYKKLSTNSQSLKTGGRGSDSKIGNTFNIDMHFNPGFDYKGGVYVIGVVYTLTQQ